MNPPPIPEDAVLGSAAVPLDAIPGDAVATGDEAVPTLATAPTKKTETTLCIAGDDMPHPELYCDQFFGIPAAKVRTVSSWKAMMDEIFSYERIDTLVVLSHGGLSAGEIYLGGKQRTLSMFARGVTPDVADDPFPGLATWSGSIGTLKLEGCSVGADPVALHDFAAAVPAGRVEAWTMARYLDVYSITIEGDRESFVGELRASGALGRAVPYLPKGAFGGTYTAAEIEAELLKNGTFMHFAEVFGSSLAFGTERFGDLVAQPVLPFVTGTHFTRAEGTRNSTTVRSTVQASELAVEINRSRAELHQVVAAP